MSATASIETSQVESTHEESVDRLVRVRLREKDYVIFRGTREAFVRDFHKMLSGHCPDLISRFPGINPATEDYGFIGGCVIFSTRENQPYYWVGLPKTRHLQLEEAIQQYGTDEEREKLARFKRGFMTNNGRAVSRTAARSIAFHVGQLKKGASAGYELYSVDVW
jgi:hypothetical protein